MTDPSIWREYGAPLLPPLASGPLDGRTVAVKDLFAVAGYPVGAGNPAWLEQARTEPDDAPAVARLREAGAAIAGIARTDELAFSLSGVNAHYGAPPNPAAPGRVTGGSSSGPASAVAAGQADIGLGTDTAGSVRVPASVCGLFGFRPTHGAVPADRVLPLAPSFDTVGWITPTAALLAEAGAVLLPPGAGSPPTRIITIDSPNGSSLLPRVPHLPIDADEVLSPSDLDSLLAAFRTVQASEAWAAHGSWITANPGALSADVEARFRFGADVTPADQDRARKVIAGYRARVLDMLGDGTWLALPAAGGPGHRRDATAEEKDTWRQATLRRTVLASAFGLPSVSVPAGSSPPEGIALIGPPGTDRALLHAIGAGHAA
jgi:Asp-tRNA(Asn)/Glu-tRNA(Gln) amidotransferase A subunit family amidase